MAKNGKAKAPKKPREKMGRKKIINTVCIIFLSILLVGSVSVFAIVQSVLSSENLEGIDGLDSADSTQIYDENGELTTTLSSKSGVRESIKYEQIPQVIIDAFLSIEDSRFYKHNGFDFPRFMKSGYENLKAGGIAQGGSTITMQLIDVALWSDEEKNEFGFKEKLEQKIQEIFKSMEVESKINKEKIIENYLNKINFGGPARGIQKGAKFYFGKDVSEITLNEAAFLAGVINAPGAYNPYLGVEVRKVGKETITINHYEIAEERRNKVLDLMVHHGYLSKAECSLAKSQKLAFALNGVTNFETEKNKAFVDAAIREVRKKTGEDPYVTPMKIYTTMNKDAQEKADALCDGEGIDWPDELFQTGFAAVNNQTGEVKALGGGRGYDGLLDRATIDTHQIGSTSKPIVDYAPAFEYLGYSTEHTLLDGPVNYTDDGKSLYNADRKFRGDVSLKQAIGTSLNIPAYKTMVDVVNKIGVDKWIELLNKMGLEVNEKDFSYAMSIGGGDLSKTPLQLAGAFSVFANKGDYIEPYTVKKVVFQEGKKTYKASQEKENVYSEETAYLMSYMLKDAVDNSSYQTLVNTLKSSYPVYGKSGTSSFEEDGKEYGIPVGAARDKWMVGYTSNHTVSCWAGYDKPIAGQNTWLDDNKLWANIEGTIVKSMLDVLEAGKNVEAIKQPSGVTNLSFVKGLYPYAAASDETDPSMMVTGLINKKFAKLGSVSPDGVSSLASLDANLDGNKLTINFAAYPDAEKLKKSNGTTTVKAGGLTQTLPIFFDKSLLFGAIEYKYEIKVNGRVVKTSSSSSNVINETLNTKSGDEVTISGWYGYQNATAKSNTKNATVTSSVKEVYTISFETNGGSSLSPLAIKDGETITLPPNPTLSGKTFKGWYIDASLSVEFTTTTKITSDLTLYAKWE